MYNSNQHIETNISNIDFIENTPALDSIFLFIGNSLSDSEGLKTYHKNSYNVTDFAGAKKKLKLFKLPQLIIIDIPLNLLQLVEFKVWLTLNHLNGIPLIYNESFLKTAVIKQLFRQRLVDDVVNLQSNYSKLPYKAKFLLKHNNNTTQNKIINDSKDHNKEGSFFIMRFFDIITSLIAIICLIPLFIIIAIAIKLESKGPVFYSSLRAGMGFKIFYFYKFRTMIIGADKKLNELEELNIYASGHKKANFFKVKDDPRITKIGTFLRNSSLDELPQLFNVLLGDMSIVGNRPLPLYEASSLTTNEWAERFMAPAGITGLWQISKRGKAEMSNEERILLDINYARNRSLKGDFKILIQTPTALLQKANV